MRLRALVLLWLFVFPTFSLTFALWAAPPEIVYRAVARGDSPEAIRRAGGFYARGMDGSRANQPPPDISLYNHAVGAGTGLSRHNSGYVATTVSRNEAVRWINNHFNYAGFIYHIDPTPNFVDVNASLGRFSPHSGEREFAALGRIRWDQVIGWEEIRVGQEPQLTYNPDYRPAYYRHLTSSGEQPQLAGFPADHRAWGLLPWRNFANCGSPISHQATDTTAVATHCRPKLSAQAAGEKAFFALRSDVLAPTVYLITSRQQSRFYRHDEL